jgi:hypothetical protein
MPALGSVRHDHWEFKSSLSYTVRPCLFIGIGVQLTRWGCRALAQHCKNKTKNPAKSSHRKKICGYLGKGLGCWIGKGLVEMLTGDGDAHFLSRVKI